MLLGSPPEGYSVIETTGEGAGWVWNCPRMLVDKLRLALWKSPEKYDGKHLAIDDPPHF